MKRVYKFTTLPFERDNERFAIPYTPDSFTDEEKKYLSPFFTNLDKPVFVVKNLPEEVKGALASRYSRSTKSLRLTFLKEYIMPILHPEKQKSWEELSEEEKQEAKQTKKLLTEWIDFVQKKGGMESVVNVQRGRAFFEKWLAQYGDDSIAELGGELICLEGLSNIATKEIQDQRIGLSPLEKSSRYVQFWDKRPDGAYQYIVPGEIRGTKYEKPYTEAMDKLFDTYANLAEPYFAYIKQLYPKGEDENDKPFQNSRSAKRFDDIRDLLPFSTQTSMAMYGNGRAFEGLLNRLLNHPLGEVRWWGQGILRELEQVVPSFVKRPKTERGAETQTYRANVISLREELAGDLLGGVKHVKPARWVKLISSTPDAAIEILSAFLFAGKTTATAEQIRKKVFGMGKKKRAELIGRILAERQFGRGESKREADRFRKVPRAFENAHFFFECWGRSGDYRDLHRHRQMTQERQRFTTKWGYDLEKEVVRSKFAEKFKKALEQAAVIAEKLEKVSPDVAQYAVPFGYLTHWYMNMSAREIYWLVEIRTGPQGRPHYREICQQIATLAKEASPAVFQGIMVDMNDYSLARRESEKKIDKRMRELERKK